MELTEHLQRLEQVSREGAGREQFLRHLRASRYFVGFDDADLNHLTDLMHVFRARPGDMILQENELSDFMIIILDGLVDIIKVDDGGNPIQIAQASKGKILGEMALVDGQPRFASCMANTNVTFATLSRQDLMELVAHQPNIGAQLLLQVLALMCQRLRQTSQRLVNALQG